MKKLEEPANKTRRTFNFFREFMNNTKKLEEPRLRREPCNFFMQA